MNQFITVPFHPPAALWALSPEDFNAWRRDNDLPMLLSFFKGALPAFEEWMGVFSISDETFCAAPRTGEWFIGKEVLEFNRYKKDGKEEISIVKDFASHFEFLAKHHEFERLDALKFMPYLAWGKKRFGKTNFILSDKYNKGYTAVPVYGLTSHYDDPRNSRTALMKEFYVVKLGGCLMADRADWSQRNLDFADLDDLSISGDWHGSFATAINFSSCRNLRFNKAHLHHVSFKHCEATDIKVIDSLLQDFAFLETDLGELSLLNSRINGLVVKNCRYWWPIINDTDIQRFIYEPPENVDHRAQADICRRLRSAFQSKGHRADSSRFYYLERSYERKWLWYPYRFYGGDLPSRRYNGRLKELSKQVKEGVFTRKQGFAFAVDIIWFHFRIWFNPRYTFRAIGFKWRYFGSLLEGIIWGYGERPARVLGTSAVVIAAFSAIYYSLQIKKSILESFYYSVFTFTTLGYGDVTQLSNGMKVATSIEVTAGIVLLGLYVGTLANRARY